MAEHSDDFRALGFETDEIGGAVKVSAIPMALSGIDLQRFFDDIVGELLRRQGPVRAELPRSFSAKGPAKPP